MCDELTWFVKPLLTQEYIIIRRPEGKAGDDSSAEVFAKNQLPRRFLNYTDCILHGDFILHPDFIEIWYSWKTHTYDSTLNAFKKEEKPDYKIHSQDFYITESSDNFVQILYKTANISDDGYISKYAKRSSIWVLQNDTWKMKYHQATPSSEFNIQD